MIQKELFRTSLLAKLLGHLVLVSVNPSGTGPLICPACRKTAQFQEHQGWLECSCYDFAVLKSHYDEIAEQWGIK